MGLTQDTQSHFNEIFNLEERGINPDVLHKGRLTGETTRLLLLAFNLWGGYPTTYPKENDEFARNISSSVDDIFSRELSFYYLQALEIRYQIAKKENRRKASQDF